MHRLSACGIVEWPLCSTVLKRVYVDEAKHVAHDIGARPSQVPTSASSIMMIAQSREADDSTHWQWQHVQQVPEAACESTGMIL